MGSPHRHGTVDLPDATRDVVRAGTSERLVPATAAHPRHSPPRCAAAYGRPVVTRIPAATGVTQARTTTPSTTTRHSWHTPIPQ